MCDISGYENCWTTPGWKLRLYATRQWKFEFEPPGLDNLRLAELQQLIFEFCGTDNSVKWFVERLPAETILAYLTDERTAEFIKRTELLGWKVNARRSRNTVWEFVPVAPNGTEMNLPCGETQGLLSEQMMRAWVELEAIPSSADDDPEAIVAEFKSLFRYPSG